MPNQSVQLNAPSDAIKGIQKIILSLGSEYLDTMTITLYQYGLKRYISIPALHLHAPDVHAAICVQMHLRYYLSQYYCDEFGQVHLKHKDNVFVQKLLEMCPINEFEISREALFIENWSDVLSIGYDVDLTAEELANYTEIASIRNV